MKLLNRDNIKPYEDSYYLQQCQYLMSEEHYGKYYLFADNGKFLGVSLEGEKEAITATGKVSMDACDYKEEGISFVKYYRHSFNDISLRLKHWVANALNKCDSVKLEASNPFVLLNMEGKPVYLSYGENKFKMTELETNKEVVAVYSREILPCKYKETREDVRYAMHAWMKWNDDKIRMNLTNAVHDGQKMMRLGKYSGVVIKVGGHLLGAYLVNGECKTGFIREEGYAEPGWKETPLLTISCEDLKKVDTDKLFDEFKKYLAETDVEDK